MERVDNGYVVRKQTDDSSEVVVFEDRYENLGVNNDPMSGQECVAGESLSNLFYEILNHFAVYSAEVKIMFNQKK